MGAVLAGVTVHGQFARAGERQFVHDISAITLPYEVTAQTLAAPVHCATFEASVTAVTRVEEITASA